jgi:hypothetical protein
MDFNSKPGIPTGGSSGLVAAFLRTALQEKRVMLTWINTRKLKAKLISTSCISFQCLRVEEWATTKAKGKLKRDQ